MSNRQNQNQRSEMWNLMQPDMESPEQSQTSTSRGRAMLQGAEEAAAPSFTSRGRTVARRAEEEEQAEEEGPSCGAPPEVKFVQQCRRKLGELKFSPTHTVLIDILLFNRKLGLIPYEGKDVWQHNYVKMPCSKVVNQLGASQEPRWKVICKRLSSVSQKQEVSVSYLEESIMKYNSKFKGRWSFEALHMLVKNVPKLENYYQRLFPRIAALALQLPQEVKTAVPLLRTGSSHSITLSQTQISCLLANAFFCTFPHRNSTGANTEYHSFPNINFSSLFADWSLTKKEKLRAILHYFNVVTNDKTKPEGLVTFERRCLKPSDLPNWRSSSEKMDRLYVTSQGHIEKEGTGLLQVDFASPWVGGGVLGSGLVQEEILFLMNPELIISRLFTERLADNECLIITGAQQFSLYSGYSDTFEWAGPNDDNLQRDGWSRLNRQILAVDAIHFRDPRDQYKMGTITRELNKAFCGFKGQPGWEEPDIATGKWGCGAFKGDPQLKALIQLMAAARAKRGLVFFTFNDQRLKEELQHLHRLLVDAGITVGQLYDLLNDFCHDSPRHVNLFDFIKKRVVRPSQSLL